MCLRKWEIPKLIICIFYFALFCFFFLVIWHWTVVKALAVIAAHTLSTEHGLSLLYWTHYWWKRKDSRRQKKSRITVGEAVSWRMGALYLYMNIHTPVYYPVNYVEIGRSRDVFRVNRWGSKYNLKGSSATETSHGWVPYVWRCGCGSHSDQCSAQSAVNHREADAETTSPLSPRWGGAVMKVNYCVVKSVTLSAVTKRHLRIWTSVSWKLLSAHSM